MCDQATPFFFFFFQYFKSENFQRVFTLRNINFNEIIVIFWHLEIVNQWKEYYPTNAIFKIFFFILDFCESIFFLNKNKTR